MSVRFYIRKPLGQEPHQFGIRAAEARKSSVHAKILSLIGNLPSGGGALNAQLTGVADQDLGSGDGGSLVLVCSMMHSILHRSK